MKLLLDTCVRGGARSEIVAAGHDVVWSGDWPNDPGDMAILSYAHNNYRILVTIDKDFGELAIVRDMPHSGNIRLVNWSAKQQAAACLRALELYGDQLILGAIVTIDPKRVRIRPPEVPPSDN